MSIFDFGVKSCKPVTKIEKDTDRDYFMSAEEAKKYGVIDDVIHETPTKPKK